MYIYTNNILCGFLQPGCMDTINEYDFVIVTMNAVVTFSTNHPVEDNLKQYTVYIKVQTLVAADIQN